MTFTRYPARYEVGVHYVLSVIVPAHTVYGLHTPCSYECLKIVLQTAGQQDKHMQLPAGRIKLRNYCWRAW